jgi:acyl-CoA reductase-like NAD-dependent aldehyde dehydrogenase
MMKMSGQRMRSWIDIHSGKTYKNYSNGEWIASFSGKTYPLYESARPSNKIGEFPDSDKADVDRAVEAAHEAFQTWKNQSAAARTSILFRFADLLEKHKEELAYMISAEQGKVLAEALGEVQRAANEARFNAGEALRVDGQTLPSENELIRVSTLRYPIGVIAAIAPWNFPVVTPVRKIVPALAHGCTVVYKPASATPWTSARLVELFVEAGVPKGVVNLVFGSGSKVGDPLVAHPLVKGISFTGSTELGMRINGVAAARLAKTQLELGGKNAALVLDYDNLAYAADQIVSAAFACSGQRCTAISRVIVLKDRSQALIEQLKEKIKNIRVGPAWEDGVTMGPLMDRRQYESVTQYIEIGIKEGASLVMGGERLHADDSDGDPNEAYYLTPALFTNVQEHMRIAKEEIFGPVLCVIEANDLDEALKLANSTDYGLAASVFTNSLETSQYLSSAIESGMIHMNHGTASQIHVPFGGMNHSGAGAFSIGHSNQEFYTGVKAIYVKSR